MTVHIRASGELQARRSEKIKGPDGLRTVGLYRVTIEDLVPEGKVVKEGEYIASLDKTELDGKITESQNEIDKIVTQLDQAKIDTAIEMRALRDQLINLKYSMEEKKVTLELSKYEPKAVQQQARLDLEKAEREYDQLQNKLELTKEKSIARVEEINASYRQQEFKLNRLLDFQKKMTIRAPKEGMVIYLRNWDGKRGPGSQISAWDPVVAELPDLSEMITKAYINEVDISKVMPGQDAIVTVDAFPGKEFEGMVVSKANIGEQVRNFDTKVFEVIVYLQGQDSLLRPAMTTGIEIAVDSVPNCLQVPLEAIHNDSVTFVYMKTRSGFVKQEVVTGPSNDVSMSIALGLNKGDEVSLTPPSYAEDLDIQYLDVNDKAQVRSQLESEYAARLKKQQDIAKTVKQEDFQTDDSEGGGRVIFF
jgi:multidrug efflux pump subunit AcrA (membrane-fusion protein)